MRQDRDEKYEESDEPEYHFSEEEGGDYVDSDIPRDPGVAPEPKIEQASPAAGMSSSKRMMISLVVFLGLVYVVYKMVAPSSQTPATDIVPAMAAQSATQTAKSPPPLTPPAPIVQQQAAATPPSVPTPQPVQAAVPTPAAPPAMAVAPESTVQPQAMVAAPSQAAAPAPLLQTNTPAASSPPAAAPPANVVATSAVPSTVAPSQPATIQPTPAAPAPAQQQEQPSSLVATLPPVIPVQSQAPTTYPAAQPASPVAQAAAAAPTASIPLPAGAEAKVAVLEAESTRLMGQLQSDYSQKLNDFSTVNKALQEQVQTLNSRMSTMEAQINQLVQALTRANQNQSQNNSTYNESAASAAEPLPAAPDQRVSYNVQAIIPGRAWLKSDNGDTLTVAEGDTIKSLGRVVKIDPYDGIVEINTGSKTISLSYGNGA